MRQLFYFLVFLNVLSCDSEDAWDCIQSSGAIRTQEIAVNPFSKIQVNRGIELIVKEGPVYAVEIQTGENLIHDLQVQVVDNELQLSNHNTCNYTREYGLTKITVTTPSLTHIRSNTQYMTSSSGILNFENLTLLSEDYISDFYNVGDFDMTVNTQNLSVVANNLSVFTISGFTEKLVVGFYSGTCQFNGAELIAQHVDVFQRSSHDITVNPQESLGGEIRSVGDVISIRTPPIVTIQQHYTGQLLFLD